MKVFCLFKIYKPLQFFCFVVNSAKALLPNITTLVQDLYKRINTPVAKLSNASFDVNALRKMIETARSQANEVSTSVCLFVCHLPIYQTLKSVLVCDNIYL